jgi:hypothetical protein
VVKVVSAVKSSQEVELVADLPVSHQRLAQDFLEPLVTTAIGMAALVRVVEAALAVSESTGVPPSLVMRLPQVGKELTTQAICPFTVPEAYLPLMKPVVLPGLPQAAEAARRLLL